MRTPIKVNIFLVLIAISVIILACNEDQDPVDDFTTGQNYYTTLVDEVEREYYVHVPTGYSEDVPIPVVFMLHGTSGNGLKFYNISGWKEVGETETILTVYPSSGRYCIIDDGEVKNTTKWTVYDPSYDYCEGEIPLDDIKFLRQIIDELNERFNVDNKRIHMVGFSNGGQMTFRSGVDMSDLLASIVQSGGTYNYGTTFSPLRDLPVIFQLGNTDDLWFDPGVTVPMALFDSLITTAPLMQRIIASHTGTFSFETEYTITGNPNSALTATFKGIPDEGNRDFLFFFIKDMGHVYPNGTNHPIMGAEQNWEWMKQFALP